jgi:hypothetical protein
VWDNLLSYRCWLEKVKQKFPAGGEVGLYSSGGDMDSQYETTYAVIEYWAEEQHERQKQLLSVYILFL